MNVDELRSKVDEVARGLEEAERLFSNESEVKNDAKVRKAFDEAKRAIRQFGCLDKMIVVTCGMLKAGKSTLINLLARSDMASPVGFGVDTTLRPALIRMGDTQRGWIRLYYASGTDDKIRKARNQVFDVVRGVKLDERAEYEEEKVELTKDNLKLCLCNPVDGQHILTREPLLIVVEIPHHDASCLLSKDVMLLDMPGLDSGNSEVSRTIEDYGALIDECDMFFFVQSSVSPLNKSAKGLLVSALRYRNPETTFVIQNRIESKPWLNNELQKQAQTKQAQKAREEVLECFRKNNRSENELKGVRIITMNLGMAHDAMVNRDDGGLLKEGESFEELEKASDFLGFEDFARRVMQEKGAYFRMMHCRDVLTQQIENIKEAVDGVKVRQLDPLLAKEESNLNAWRGVKLELELLGAKISLGDYKHRLKDEDLTISDDLAGKIKDRLGAVWNEVRGENQEWNRLFCDDGKAVKGSVIDGFVEKCSEVMRNKVNEVLQKECSIEHVKVSIESGRALTDFLNAALREAVFEKCAARRHQNDCPAMWRELEENSMVGFEFIPSALLRDHKDTNILCVQGREPSNNGGIGYPFVQKQYVFFEKKKKVENARKCFNKTLDEYVDDVKLLVKNHGKILANELFEYGKRRGLEGSIGFASDRVDEFLGRRDKIKDECLAIENCDNKMKKLSIMVERIA